MDTNFILSATLSDYNVILLAAFTMVPFVIAFVIFGIGKKNKFAMKFILPCAGVYLVAAILAGNNIPEFIRKIPGETFLGMYFSYCVIVVIVTLIFLLVYYDKAYGKILDAAQHKPLSDRDLMLLQGFDRYNLTGYYLLKAKLDGLIEVRVIPETETAPKDVHITLNKDISPEKLNAYCRANPQVSGVISYIKTSLKRNNPDSVYESEKTVKLLNVVKDVNIRSELNSNCGKFIKEELEALKPKSIYILLISAAAAYLPATVKLIMGIQNMKPVGSLFGMMFMLAIGFRLFYGIINAIKDNKDKNMIAKLAMSKRSVCKNPEKLFDLVSVTDAKFKEQDAVYLLRAYALYYFNWRISDNKSEDPFVSVLFGSIKSLQYAQYLRYLEENKNRSDSDSGSGCSSCSSCSSCGSCGGCGGCGD